MLGVSWFMIAMLGLMGIQACHLASSATYTGLSAEAMIKPSGMIIGTCAEGRVPPYGRRSPDRVP
jgi:hypothetical protein